MFLNANYQVWVDCSRCWKKSSDGHNWQRKCFVYGQAGDEFTKEWLTPSAFAFFMVDRWHNYRSAVNTTYIVTCSYNLPVWVIMNPIKIWRPLGSVSQVMYRSFSFVAYTLMCNIYLLIIIFVIYCEGHEKWCVSTTMKSISLGVLKILLVTILWLF